MTLSTAKLNMLKQQLRTWGVLNERILALFADVPREQFVPESYQAIAYADCEIPLGDHHYLLPPKEAALMLQALNIQPADQVLELGTNSGYHTALLARLAKNVTTVDVSPAFIEKAQETLPHLGLTNIEFVCQDPVTVKLEPLPTVVFIGASLAKLPTNFLEQLPTGARVCGIIGSSPIMEATVITRQASGEWVANKLFETARPRLPGVKESATFEF